MIRSPFFYFGVKYKVADQIWLRFGDPELVIDPFCGSLSLFFNRPRVRSHHREIVNDLNGFVINFWRTVQQCPDEMIPYLIRPTNQFDLAAAHHWLRYEAKRIDLPARLMGDLEYCHPKIAALWVWGHNSWIGSGWCDDNSSGPWIVKNGKLVRGDGQQRGIINKIPYTISKARGINRIDDDQLHTYLAEIQKRIRNMIITCVDWRKSLPDWLLNTSFEQPVAIFLDPPYTHLKRNLTLYHHDDPNLSLQVRQWAIEAGRSPFLRIAYCGFADREDDFPSDWERLYWNANAGYSTYRKHGLNHNRFAECIWFSPACIRPNTQLSLF